MELATFFFTFGVDHTLVKTNDKDEYVFGENLSKLTPLLYNHYVKVKAYSYIDARRIFINEFSSKYLKTPNSWCWQYNAAEFDKSFFPLGNLTTLTQKQQQQ